MLVLILNWLVLFAHAQVRTLETPAFRLSISAADGACELLDKRAGTTWRSQNPSGGLGTASIDPGDGVRRVRLGACELENGGKGMLVAIFRPIASNPSAAIRLRFRVLPGASSFAVEYDADHGLRMESLTLFEELIRVRGTGNGALLVPVREGLRIPADSGLSFSHSFDSSGYEGCHMQMIGAVQDGAALLITWSDPYVAVQVTSRTTNAPGLEQRVAAALQLRKSARSLHVHPLGKGDHVHIAKAYREIARERGLLVDWKRKLQENPERSKLAGAVNYKLWSTLDRRMSEDSSQELSARVNWTFDEAAQVAEHLKHDLKLEKVLFMLGGWIHRGYDNQHPDILPAAPECGGDVAFADCARRVRDLNYLFCLHDNYQDIYRDSPSWDERLIMRRPDGRLAKGGRWAGGLAYLTCSEMALELAKRPRNLAAVKALSGANAYFIDTTYAADLQECFDPAHPLSRVDDMRWKIQLSDYARQLFGIFGSECGREWAIPHSDFFEGMTGVSGGFYHNKELTKKLGASVVPLFELVYRDCIALYGKYGYDPAHAAAYVLHHISIGRTLNYHSIPPGLYWKEGSVELLRAIPAVDALRKTGARSFEISYRWTLEQNVPTNYRAFVHFTDASGNIKFQNDYQPDPPFVVERAAGKTASILHGPRSVSIPASAGVGTFDVRMGLFDPETGQRAPLTAGENSERSYLVARLQVTPEEIALVPASDASGQLPDAGLFTRGDSGWTAGLHFLDRFVKNTYEVLSPLNELTWRTPMTEHRFLTPDHLVQETVFGDGPGRTRVVVNKSDADFTCQSLSGEFVVLPPYGFLIESPGFIGFHARNWAGENYPGGAMFTLRSMDNRKLSDSRRVRVYHGFGKADLRIGKQVYQVDREALLEL
jgi:hypothetical protein